MAQIGRDPNKTRNELAAGESGAQAVQGASNQLHATYESGADNALKSASVFGGLAQQGEENKLRTRQLDEQERSNRMGEAMQQDRQDIEAADKGVQQQGPTRAEKLKQEMERGRQQAQMDKPLEIPGAGKATYAQSPERVAQDESKLMTSRLNAQANFMNATENLQKAQISGDKEAAKRERENLQQPIKSATNLYNRARKDQKLADNEWENLKGITEGNPDAGLQQEINSKTIGPRTLDFLQRRINFDSMRFMAATGDMPDGDFVDMASPAMVQFTQTANEMQSFLKTIDTTTNGAMSQVFGIDSLAKKNQVLRKLSAEAMLVMMANPGAAAPGSVTPSAGRQGAGNGQPQQHSGAAIDNPGGGPPLLRDRGSIERSARAGQQQPAAAGQQQRQRRPDASLGGDQRQR